MPLISHLLDNFTKPTFYRIWNQELIEMQQRIHFKSCHSKIKILYYLILYVWRAVPKEVISLQYSEILMIF